MQRKAKVFVLTRPKLKSCFANEKPHKIELAKTNIDLK
jgi:hypothetical protein